MKFIDMLRDVKKQTEAIAQVVSEEYKATKASFTEGMKELDGMLGKPTDLNNQFIKTVDKLGDIGYMSRLDFLKGVESGDISKKIDSVYIGEKMRVSISQITNLDLATKAPFVTKENLNSPNFMWDANIENLQEQLSQANKKPISLMDRMKEMVEQVRISQTPEACVEKLQTKATYRQP